MTGKREGEAFARVERKAFMDTLYLGDVCVTSRPAKDNRVLEVKAERINKAADAHALKVGLRMLEMAAKLCENPGISGFESQEIRSLAARIEKGEVVV